MKVDLIPPGEWVQDLPQRAGGGVSADWVHQVAQRWPRPEALRPPAQRRLRVGVFHSCQLWLDDLGLLAEEHVRIHAAHSEGACACKE